MKTIKFFTMAILCLAAVSCAKEKAQTLPQEGESGIVSLTIQTGQIGRAVNDPAQNGTKVDIVLANSTVYFLNSSNNIVHSRKIDAADTKDEQNHIYTFKSIPSTAKALYVVCNEEDTDITYTAKVQLSGIQAGHAEFGTITADYTKLLMSNAVGSTTTGTTANDSDPVTLALADPQPPAPAPALYEATVSLAPVVSRLQLLQVTAGAGIESFKLRGIYLDDFSPEFTVAAGPHGAPMAIGQDKSILNATFNTYMSDDYTAVPLASDAVTKAVVAGVGKCWAWQVPTGAPSRIILAFSEVTITGGQVETDKYVTVRSYKDGANAPVASFIRAKVYNIGNLTFTPDDLADVPNDEPIDVIATLQVLPWEVINIIPNL